MAPAVRATLAWVLAALTLGATALLALAGLIPWPTAAMLILAMIAILLRS